jgi:hypothetical protein
MSIYLEEREMVVAELVGIFREGKPGDVEKNRKDRTYSCYTTTTEWLSALTTAFGIKEAKRD